MPKIVDSDAKAHDICEQAYNELLNVGINNFSLNKFIVSLKMSKGQFYYYFATKEALIFEVIHQKSYKLVETTMANVKMKKTFLEKLFAFFSYYIDDTNQESLDLYKLIQESLYVYVNTQHTTITQINSDMYAYLYRTLDAIFEEMIDNGYLKQEAKEFQKSLISTADGMYFQSLFLANFDLKTTLSNYLATFDKLLKNGDK